MTLPEFNVTINIVFFVTLSTDKSGKMRKTGPKVNRDGVYHAIGLDLLLQPLASALKGYENVKDIKQSCLIQCL